jgi:Tfp pilus assembly protein PilF
MRSPVSCSEQGSSRGGLAVARRVPGLALLVLVVTGLLCGVAQAAPFRPANPELVLLELPARADLADLRRLDAEYRTAPRDPARLERLIGAQLATGRRLSDPRYFGQAEALLTGWRADHTRIQTIGLAVAWADIEQHRHDYLAARATLDQILAATPGSAQARLMRAQLGLAEGRLDEARRDCAALVREAAIGIGCLAQVLGMNGSLDRGAALMDRALLSAGRDGATLSWMLTARADMAARAGDGRFRQWLEQAHRVDPDDQYARLALADALLDAGGANEARALIAAGPRSDAALLRLAILRARGSAGPSAEAVELEARYAEAEARGEQVHLRDLARFRLDVLHDLRGALAAAKENFHLQRETWDVRILLETAHAAHDRSAVGELLEWRRRTGFEDHALDSLFAWAEARS